MGRLVIGENKFLCHICLQIQLQFFKESNFKAEDIFENLINVKMWQKHNKYQICDILILYIVVL